MQYGRGLIAAILFLVLTYFVAWKIILLPARETGLVTVKETRSLGLPQDFVTDNTVWNIVLVSTSYLSYTSEEITYLLVRRRHKWHRITTRTLQSIPRRQTSSIALFRSYLCGIIPVCFSLII